MTRQQLLRAGWTSSAVQHRVRTGEWTRWSNGVYITRPASSIGEGDRLRAALVTHGPDAVAVLGTAARIHGLAGVWPRDGNIHVARSPGGERHQQPGTVLHTWLLAPGEVVDRGGIPVTSVHRTVSDLMRRLGRFAAVSVLDSALNQRLLDRADLPRLARSGAGLRGAQRCRPWWALGDARSESPLETRIRLISTDLGYPPDELQLAVRVDGVVAARGDLAWRQPSGRWLIAEADGIAYHDRPEALLYDRKRQNLIVATGIADVVRFTWEDTSPRSDAIRSTLRQFLGPPRPPEES